VRHENEPERGAPARSWQGQMRSPQEPTGSG